MLEILRQIIEEPVQLTQEHYLECLANGMSFDEMAIELGWTRQQIKQFGERFYDRAFEERGKRYRLMRDYDQMSFRVLKAPPPSAAAWGTSHRPEPSARNF